MAAVTGGDLYGTVRLLVLQRAHGRCEGCGRKLTPDTLHAHHRRLRAHGRLDCPCNLLATCRRCHEAAHSGPQASRDVGWIVSACFRGHVNQRPVMLRGKWALLGCDGSVSHVSCDMRQEMISGGAVR